MKLHDAMELQFSPNDSSDRYREQSIIFIILKLNIC